MICGAACGPVIDLGMMPIANGFVSAAALDREERFPLVAVACSRCSMVQLAHPIAPSRLFPDDYAFHSSTSQGMASHFERLANSVCGDISRVSNPFVVEIGSNDGILLRHVAAAGVRHVGIEPAANVADVARARGVTTLSRFFDDELAGELLEKYGAADAIIAANVMCHIPEIHAVAEGISRLLKPDGFFVFEDPYLGDILDRVSFDQIYDEHVYYFSLTAVQNMLADHGLEVVDAVPQSVHGGSMRYVVALAGRRSPTARVGELKALEERLNLGDPSTYEMFRARVSAKREALRNLLFDIRRAGQRVAGYAATSKSTTAIVYCGLSTDVLEYVCDTSPGKQGLLTPGAHIPIRPHSVFAEDPPDYALLFAWNHRAEVLAKEQDFLNGGGRFITYVPEVGLISTSAVRETPGDRARPG